MKLVDINSIPRPNEQNELEATRAELMRAIKSKQRKCYIIGCLIASIPIVTLIWNFYQSKNELAAQQELFQAVFHFESGTFDKALEGDGSHKGFLSIIKSYPYTQAAYLTSLYAGIAYMHQKKYDEAIACLKKFSCKDFILQARAWAVTGDAYSAKEDYKRAVLYYMKATQYRPNSVYTPSYLTKAAIAFDKINQYKKAYNCYNEIVNKYPNTPYGTELAIKEANRLSELL